MTGLLARQMEVVRFRAEARDILLPKFPRLALETTQSAIQWTVVALSTYLKMPERESSSSAGIRFSGVVPPLRTRIQPNLFAHKLHKLEG